MTGLSKHEGLCLYDISDTAKCDLPIVRTVYNEIQQQEVGYCEAHARTIEQTRDERRKAIEKVKNMSLHPSPKQPDLQVTFKVWGPSEVDEGMHDAEQECSFHEERRPKIFRLGETYYVVLRPESGALMFACEECYHRLLKESKSRTIEERASS